MNKTAEEILREKQVEYNNSINKSENNMTDEEWKETLADPVFQSLIKAMKSYAQQECEKVRQDCADNLDKHIFEAGFGGLDNSLKEVILSTKIELT